MAGVYAGASGDTAFAVKRQLHGDYVAINKVVDYYEKALGIAAGRPQKQ
jgi:hypothetical protein